MNPEAIFDILRDCGAVAVGMAPLQCVSERDALALERWLDAGYNAGMEYMQNHKDLRLNPTLLLDGAKSIICMAFSYLPEVFRAPSLPAIASYAYTADYHDTLRQTLNIATQILKEQYGGEWRICIDSAPILERYWAEHLGVGTRCDNGLINVAGVGTRVFLSEILTTLELPDAKRDYRRNFISEGEEVCLHCGACQRACPAGALQPNSQVDARKCLSYLTIEHRGEWDEQGQAAMHTPAGRNTLYGCDICQNVCPLNIPSATPKSVATPNIPQSPINHTPPQPPKIPTDKIFPIIMTLTAREAADMTQEEFSRAFRGSSIKRTKLVGLRRNARNILFTPDS